MLCSTVWENGLKDLILNALALEFARSSAGPPGRSVAVLTVLTQVIGIDELIFEAFAPLRAKQTVEKTKLVHVHPDCDTNSHGMLSDFVPTK